VSPAEDQQRLRRIRANLERRASIFQFTRSFFTERGFLEVDTPIRMSAVAPERYITPFSSESWFLSTSPELHMKRMLAAGYGKLFQLARCFRKGESGRHHNPEFTMLEWYRAGAGYREIIADMEDLILSISRRLGMGMSVPARLGPVDIRPPWGRVTVSRAFLGAAGWDPVSDPDSDRFDMDLVTKVIPALGVSRPIVIEGYPASMAALARLSPNNPAIAERAEVFIGGLEIANAYSELNDAEEQRRRFEAEIEDIRAAGGMAVMPPHFVEAIRDLTECGGIALGMDRLVMLFCDADAIADVLPFPDSEV
jgi:lysyl-tRNA synthetase class 2